VRVGGWGYLIDDKGSAFDIGIKAITAGFRMADGRTRPTELMTLLRKKLGVRMFEEILDNIYSNQIGVEEIAELAPSVYSAAARDKVCRQILREAGTSLAELACTTAKRLKMSNTPFPLAMTGGGFKSKRYFMEQFKSQVKNEFPHARFTRLKVEPARGAYLIATKLAGHGLRGLPNKDQWLRRVIN
jgi:N-acetylglucosamine kinase